MSCENVKDVLTLLVSSDVMSLMPELGLACVLFPVSSSGSTLNHFGSPVISFYVIGIHVTIMWLLFSMHLIKPKYFYFKMIMHMCIMHCRDFGHTLCYSFRFSTCLIFFALQHNETRSEKGSCPARRHHLAAMQERSCLRKRPQGPGTSRHYRRRQGGFIVHINEKFADGAQAQNAETANAITDVDPYEARPAMRLK